MLDICINCFFARVGKSSVLVTWLKEEADPESFEALVSREGEVDRWNAVECDTALRQMTQILGRRRISDWPVANDLYERIATRMLVADRLRIRNVVTVAYVAARLNVAKGLEWVDVAFNKVSEMLAADTTLTLSEPEVSSIMTVVSTYRRAPPAPVLDAVLSVSGGLTDLRSIGSVLSGFAKANLKAEFAEAARSTEAAILSGIADTSGTAGFGPATTSVILHSYASSESPCSPALARALVQRMGKLSAGARSLEEQPSMNNCAITMWALAKLGERDLFTECESLLTPLMLRHLLAGRCSEQNVSNILISASNLGVELHKPLLKQLLTQLKSKSRDCSAQALANSLNALANWQMDAEFADLAEEIAPQLARFDQLPLANAQAASTVLWSHAACLVELESEGMRAVLKALEADVAKANTRDIPFTFYAFAVLDHAAPPSLLAALLDRTLSLRKARTWNPQELCTAIYALAVLGCVTSRDMLEMSTYWETVTVLHERLQRLEGDGGMSPIDLSMLVQAWLLFDSEPINASGAKADKRKLISKQLWDRAVESRVKSLEIVRKEKSEFAKLIGRELKEWLGEGIEVRDEIPVGVNGLLQVDFLMTVEGKQVVVECEGPSHFTSKRRVTGPTQARNLLLGREGFAVVDLPHFEHRNIKKANRAAWFETKFAAAGVQVTAASVSA